MADEKNASRLSDQEASEVVHGSSQDTAPRHIRPSPKRQCRSCHPRRMTQAEIEEYGLDKIDLDKLMGDDDA